MKEIKNKNYYGRLSKKEKKTKMIEMIDKISKTSYVDYMYVFIEIIYKKSTNI